MKLSAKHARFVSEYLIDRNATRAAMRAGYSKKTAHVQGSRLLRNAEVSAAVAKGEAKLLEDNKLSADRVLEEMRRIAFVNLGDFFDEHHNLIPLKDLTREQTAALSSVEVILKNAKAGDGVIDTVHKIKLCSKEKVLELLGKHFKLLDRLGESDLGDWEKRAAMLASVRPKPPAKP